ncbi:hypothetical protein CMI42_00605 [Candidatus Pacearchaeota archaeon]|nr:hypothetical protein [Candidatus Pacearchaeota archaeon]|tara:strand:- start:210 stop:620 length:411 start_codon:yes stop_codon:yes gene_type:complete
MKRSVSLIISSLLIITAIFLLVLSINKLPSTTGKAIETITDESCLSYAGYSFDFQLNACTRFWELDDDEKRAARIALSHLSSENPHVIEAVNLGCNGCYKIVIRSNNQDITINLQRWEIVDNKKQNFLDYVLSLFR